MASSIINRLVRLGRKFKRRQHNSQDQHQNKFKHLLETDILVASYPRSGNTWLRYLIADVVLQNAGIKTSTELPIHVDKIIPDLDRGDALGSANEFSTRRILKTHHPCNPVFQQAIVIFRNPVDCLTSFFHFHLRYENLQPFTQSGIDQFCLERFAEWQAHLESFRLANQSDLCKCHFLQYEKLHREPSIQLSKALTFMGIEHTLRQCAIAVDNHHFAKHAKHEKPKQGTSERFFRKGEIGSGARELQDSTVTTIDALHSHLIKSFSLAN